MRRKETATFSAASRTLRLLLWSQRSIAPVCPRRRLSAATQFSIRAILPVCLPSWVLVLRVLALYFGAQYCPILPKTRDSSFSHLPRASLSHPRCSASLFHKRRLSKGFSARILLALLRRAVVQLGRTLEWGSRGRGFESRRPDQGRECAHLLSPNTLKRMAIRP